jgi:hypothetical protein
MGGAFLLLGLQIKQIKDEIFISQTKYAKELHKQFGVNDSKLSKTPMAANATIDSDTSGKEVDITQYRAIIGSLLYLTASRSNIMFAVCLCARY